MKVFEITPSPKPKNFPRGFGLCAYSDAGEMFIGSIMLGMGAKTAFLACSYDGTPMVRHGNNVLVPFEWAVKERPELADGLLAFKRAADMAKGSEDGRN
jgi:hypothetical protein